MGQQSFPADFLQYLQALRLLGKNFGQRQPQHNLCAPAFAIANLGMTAVGLNRGSHKCQPQTVSGGMLPFYKSLEHAAAQAGRKTRAIVGNYQLSLRPTHLHLYVNRAARRKMRYLIIQQVGDGAMQ